MGAARTTLPSGWTRRRRYQTFRHRRSGAVGGCYTKFQTTTPIIDEQDHRTKMRETDSSGGDIRLGGACDDIVQFVEPGQLWFPPVAISTCERSSAGAHPTIRFELTNHGAVRAKRTTVFIGERPSNSAGARTKNRVDRLRRSRCNTCGRYIMDTWRRHCGRGCRVPLRFGGVTRDQSNCDGKSAPESSVR